MPPTPPDLTTELTSLRAELAELRGAAATRAELLEGVEALWERVLDLGDADRDTLVGLGDIRERNARTEAAVARLEALRTSLAAPFRATPPPTRESSEPPARAIRREATTTTARVLLASVVAFAAGAGDWTARACGIPSVAPGPASGAEGSGGMVDE